jgi:hypothetical protein
MVDGQIQNTQRKLFAFFTNQRWLFLVLVALALIVFTASLLYGAPDQLPSIALGWPLLLHVLRAGVLFAFAGGLLLILIKAWDGELPHEIGASGLRYETGGVVVEIRTITARLEQEIEKLKREHLIISQQLINGMDVLKQDLRTKEGDEHDKLEANEC